MLTLCPILGSDLPLRQLWCSVHYSREILCECQANIVYLFYFSQWKHIILLKTFLYYISESSV